jgi:hypothetical protein
MQSGWLYWDKSWFYLKAASDGKAAMLTGWQKLKWSGGTHWFYFKGGNSGRMHEGWLYWDKSWFYLAPQNGNMLTNWAKLSWSGGTHWFHFKGGNSGRMTEGWLKWKGDWYYLHPTNGNMANGRHYIDNTWYRFHGPEDGRLIG